MTKGRNAFMSGFSGPNREFPGNGVDDEHERGVGQPFTSDADHPASQQGWWSCRRFACASVVTRALVRR